MQQLVSSVSWTLRSAAWLDKQADSHSLQRCATQWIWAGRTWVNAQLMPVKVVGMVLGGRWHVPSHPGTHSCQLPALQAGQGPCCRVMQHGAAAWLLLQCWLSARWLCNVGRGRNAPRQLSVALAAVKAGCAEGSCPAALLCRKLCLSSAPGMHSIGEALAGGHTLHVSVRQGSVRRETSALRPPLTSRRAFWAGAPCLGSGCCSCMSRSSAQNPSPRQMADVWLAPCALISPGMLTDKARRAYLSRCLELSSMDV